MKIPFTTVNLSFIIFFMTGCFRFFYPGQPAVPLLGQQKSFDSANYTSLSFIVKIRRVLTISQKGGAKLCP